MNNYQELMTKVLQQGEARSTRSGDVHGIFGANLEFDLREGFPAVTTKKLMFKAMAGELLWFLNGMTDLASLRHFSCLPKDAWTIWTNDCTRWHGQAEQVASNCDTPLLKDDLGELYGAQWRSYEGVNGDVDQIENLVESLRTDPFSRYHIVNSWNVGAINDKLMALPPCHVLFQCYVSADGHLDLMWYQRSVDVFLGLPFNIASYALLMEVLCSITGLKPRMLKCQLADVHIYDKHREQAYEQVSRTPYALPTLVLPEINNLNELYSLTANDFKLEGYECHAAIKAPLEVG